MQVLHYLAASSAPVRATDVAARWAERSVTALHQTLALVLLLAVAPVLAVIALLIWRTDGPPLLYGHFRVGRDGELFRCLKFRTMRVDADVQLARLLAEDPAAREEWQRDQKLRHDPRVTPIGRFLRKTSLDELPQLINVLRGEMRLVGPRPVTPAELRRYDVALWHYVSVHPGITGLWQVSGRNRTTYDERVALDRHYIENASLALDLKILLRTVVVVVTGHGAS